MAGRAIRRGGMGWKPLRHGRSRAWRTPEVTTARGERYPGRGKQGFSHRDPSTGKGIHGRGPRPVVPQPEWPHAGMGRWLGAALWRIARRDWG